MQRFENRNFALELGDPVVVAQGRPWDEVGWGPVQFPALSRTDRGHLLCTWAVGPDSIECYEESAGLAGGAVSEDGGRSWRARTGADRMTGLPMANGREFFRPDAKNCFPAPWITAYTPAAVSPVDGGFELYRADEIPEYPRTPLAKEFDPETGTLSTFPMRVNWPHCPLLCFVRPGRRIVYPFETLMGAMAHLLPDGRGGLYLSTYCSGASAVTGEVPLPGIYNVYVFHSGDSGRTWDFVSEVLTGREHFVDSPAFEGFCEPCLARMPDGSHVMLMRTGGGCSSYLVRSTDGCRSWSRPAVFDRVGVFPQLCPLDCGVSLAGYGRPGLFLRATDDPSGLTWEAPVDLGLAPDDSCCYTSLLPLDDATALLTYSRFHEPTPDGGTAKSILVRRVKVLL